MSDHRRLAKSILSAHRGVLTPWEVSFLDDVARKRIINASLTPRQVDILKRIHGAVTATAREVSHDDIARAIGMDLNPRLSSKAEWRFGRKGSFAVDRNTLVWFSHEEGRGGHVRELIGGRLTPACQTRMPTPKHRWSDEAAKLWDSTAELQDTAGALYLFNRGCILPTSGDVRFLERAWHWIEKQYTPALVSRVVDFVTGEALTLHQTHISADGQKAEVEPRKLMLANHAKAGGVIRLSAGVEASSTVGVAEGVETGLTIAGTGWGPMLAAIDAGNMASLPVLEHVKNLGIFADHDAPGIKAANTLYSRWAAAGRFAFISKPPVEGLDWNDYENLD